MNDEAKAKVIAESYGATVAPLVIQGVTFDRSFTIKGEGVNLTAEFYEKTRDDDSECLMVAICDENTGDFVFEGPFDDFKGAA